MNTKNFSRSDFLKGIFAATATCATTGALTGCKSVPTTDGMYSTSLAIGYAAGMIANLCKIKDEDRNVVIDIVNIVSQVTPEVGQTFTEAWTPIAQAHVDKLVAEGKVDEAMGEIIMTAFSLVVKGLDYIFEVRYPKAKQYKELVAAAIDGFTTGFLTVFKPVNSSDDTTKSNAARAVKYYDREAYDWLMANK